MQEFKIRLITTPQLPDKCIYPINSNVARIAIQTEQKLSEPLRELP